MIKLKNQVNLRNNRWYCFISGPTFGVYQTTSTIYFSNSRSLERQGLMIETLEYLLMKPRLLHPVRLLER